jgi:hypothetical protein
MRELFFIPSPLAGKGGEQSARLRASATRYGEPGGGQLQGDPTPGAARRTLPFQGRDKKERAWP